MDQSFSNAQLNLYSYKIQARRYRDKNGSGLIESTGRGINCKRINDFELGFLEWISHSLIPNKFREVANKHAPLKPKILRSSHFPVVTKEFQKAIYTRTYLKKQASLAGRSTTLA